MLISILIADDHPSTRQGLRAILENHLEARVVDATGDGLEVIPLLEHHDPDLLILDLGLPGLNGLDVLHEIKSSSVSVNVVVLSMHKEKAYIAEAFEYGASAYVLKGSSTEELLDAIRAAANGRRYLGTGLSPSILDDPSAPDPSTDRYNTLTKREREVLQLIAEGLTSDEIGERLHISPRTVDKHRENLKAKLELRNSVELTRFFLRRAPSSERNRNK